LNDLLHDLYLFRGLDESNLQLVDRIASLRHYRPGDEIFRQGEAAVSLFVIQHGTVRIEQDMADGTRVEVAMLGTGSHFGEMALLDKERRSASAFAESDCDIVVIEYDALQALLESNAAIATHFYRELARFLCSRLRLTTLDLTYSRTQNLSHF
jgi:CRP-like cAMP-binding protein